MSSVLKHLGAMDMSEDSAIERIKELDRERAKIFDKATDEALEKANDAVAVLNSLGLSYRLVNGAEQPARPQKATIAQRGTVKVSPCPVCEFQTSPPHDARAHRGQAKKKPFSAAELTSKGLTKV